MQQPRAFCRAVMHEYERQWSRATGHGVRHPLRLKIATLQQWCSLEESSASEFEARLIRAEASDDVGESLLAEELLPLWNAVKAGRNLPFADD